MVERKPSRAPGHDAKRHRRPSDVNWPAVRDGELDDKHHDQQPQSGHSRSEAEHQQDWQADLRRAPGQERK